MKTALSAALAATILVTATPPALAQSGQDLFQQALVKERADGELQQAIALYERIAREYSADRSLAANALVRMGQCYEKLGSTEAERAYQRVVSEFSDQADLVAQARSRLAALRAVTAPGAPSGPVARRLLEDDGCDIEFMRPSPDGTRVAYVHLCEGLAVFVRDLASGNVKQITTEGGHIGIAWSPDGGRVASLEVFPRAQLKIFDLATGTVEEPAFLEGVGFLPDDWSPDGEHLAGMLMSEPGGRSTLVVSLRTGERIPLADRVGQELTRTAFSPDGRHVAFADYTEENQDIYVLTLGTRERLRVTTAPEADEDAVWSPDGTTIVYHNPLGTWAIPMADGRAAGEPRLVRSEPYLAPTGNNSWTPNGYYYVSVNAVVRPARIPMDPVTAQARGEPEVIDGPIPALQHNSRFVWSPDMERLAFTGGDEQEVIHILRGQSVVSHRLDRMRVADLWWSADGSEILFYNTTSDRSDPYRTVYGLDPVSGRIRELFPPTSRAHNIHVSSDGASMVFLRPLQVDPDSGGRQFGELVVSELGDPEGGRVLVSTADIDGWLGTHYGQPRLSPDGSQVVYFRHQYTGPEYDDFDNSLWVQPVDGSGPARKLGMALRQDWVSWDPSGRWIVYQRYQENPQGALQGMLSVVSVETGENHEILTWGEGVAPGEALTNVQLVAWSPDGRWIGITQATGNLEYWVVDDPLRASPGPER